MAPRPVWKGYLKLSLVSCAIELTAVTDQSEKVSFRIINRKTGNTVRRQYVDSVTGKPVSDEDEVKGYEIGDNEYLLVEEDEIDSVEIESSHTTAIEYFVDRSDIPDIYFDTPYYVTPADEVSEEAYAVIRQAMKKEKKAGIARMVLYRRERPVMIEPFDKGLLLTTLRYDKTVRKPDEIFGELPDGELNDELVSLATHIIDKKQASFDPSHFEDRYEEALLELIEAKRKGRKPPVVQAAERPANVVNLFDALKRSLAGEEEGASARGSRARTSPTKKSLPKASSKTSAKASSSGKSPSRAKSASSTKSAKAKKSA
ncbi:non-homologous end joining protein Ku [Chelatococcus asaccharovorans]|uniref:non-homologous end joining protein Ku n=1 Tax=Chelatococcus asaccharovorans TaxID=28210 RepID=UPI00224C6A81|nr:Ku protein [Chelatococcus asaccharovorans]CAH1657439.1 Non-homologous end joining protein Ku [Chelatococcus asaccharovorans]CAH1687709.1 Non-homologous end joining protein Ku [Chelatococcus asaccharovorans]